MSSSSTSPSTKSGMSRHFTGSLKPAFSGSLIKKQEQTPKPALNIAVLAADIARRDADARAAAAAAEAARMAALAAENERAGVDAEWSTIKRKPFKPKKTRTFEEEAADEAAAAAEKPPEVEEDDWRDPNERGGSIW